ncbi:MAG: 30S ribosomal protein S17 [Elusimicrobia bacterium]|jgi:small subunit ribosomal protein S17|nr:30S ribosomal protein S17 [Elusimicrobiota bacterium]
MEARKKTKVEKTGEVVSSKNEKSRVVLIKRRVQHPVYKKYFNKIKKVMAHDEKNLSKEGDIVRIVQCRPLSKRKRWKIVEISERGAER